MNKGKLKTNRGITLVTLIITIIVILIIAGTTVYTSLDRFEINRLKKMYNDIELLSDKVNNYYLQYKGLPLVKDTNNNAIQYTYTTLDFEKNVNDSGNYYIIDLTAMEGISLNYGEQGFNNPNTSEDVYIINEVSHVIYYVQGIEADGEMYHTIPEDENSINDTIPPSKPEIKIISGTVNSEGKYMSDVEIEMIPGKDNWSGVNKTTYSINDGTEIDITTLTNNILKITENGTYTIKLKTYDNNGLSSQEEISFVIKKIPEKAYIVTLVDGSYFKEASYIDKIKTITFVKGIDTTAVSNAIKTYELGDTTNGTEKDEVMGWIDSNYNLYIGSDSTIYSKDLQYAFYNMNAVTNITFNNLNTSECNNMNLMFGANASLLKLDLSGFDTSNVTNMAGMFNGCSTLADLNLSNFNTSNVTSMYDMFRNCEALNKLDISKFDTSKVTNMITMFYGCSTLADLNLSNFNTSNVINMSYMFYGCKALTTLNISSFDTSKVTNMYAMFYNCSTLADLNVSNFDTSNVTNMGSMMYGCSTLTDLNLSNFNTSKVKNMAAMFYICKGLTTLNLSSFNTSQVTNMSGMFAYCTKLTSLNMSQATFENVTTYSNMFISVSTNILIVSNSTGQTFLRARLDETIGSGNGTIVTV